MAVLHLIEDDQAIRSAIIRALDDRGHVVTSSPDAMSGLQAVIDRMPDLIILDLGLPDLDGVELLRMLRAVTDTPVIIATARDDDVQVVRALDAGADDYVVKPFCAEEEPGPITVGGLVVDPRSREASLDGRSLDLAPREFDLLAYLAARPGQVVSKRDLLADVWRLPYGGTDKTVDVHLSWLRRKMGEAANEPRYLITVRGVGVKLVEPEV